LYYSRWGFERGGLYYRRWGFERGVCTIVGGVLNGGFVQGEITSYTLTSILNTGRVFNRRGDLTGKEVSAG